MPAASWSMLDAVLAHLGGDERRDTPTACSSPDFDSVTGRCLRSLLSTPEPFCAAAVHEHQRDVLDRARRRSRAGPRPTPRAGPRAPRTTTQRVLENSDGAASSPSVASERSAPRVSENSASPSWRRTASRTARTVRSLRNSSLPVTRVTRPRTSAGEGPAMVRPACHSATDTSRRDPVRACGVVASRSREGLLVVGQVAARRSSSTVQRGSPVSAAFDQAAHLRSPRRAGPRRRCGTRPGRRRRPDRVVVRPPARPVVSPVAAERGGDRGTDLGRVDVAEPQRGPGARGRRAFPRALARPPTIDPIRRRPPRRP